ncbi:MAG: cardiolipin synthase [Verrucomicrobiae bacterium]|nr:cardiolipin synthase [Verrucomicrobiae bacterium]
MPIPAAVITESLADLIPDLLRSPTLWTALLVVAEIAALLSIVHAIIRARTAAGAWGWALGLFSFPFVAVPLYWVFGRKQFRGYRETLREAEKKREDLVEAVFDALEPHFCQLSGQEIRYGKLIEKLGRMGFTRDNAIDLLVDGAATFDAIFEEIEKAESYILIQFFIIKDDELGRELRRRLIEKARHGVRVHVLYDEIGSHKLKRSFVRSLEREGIEISEFQTTRGKSNRFQINFRNHRKIVVVDGRVAFTGGHNVGDEYLGKNPRFGRWRDTHVSVRGPAVLMTQLVFLGDWYWATREILELDWRPHFIAPDKGATMLPLATGPTEELEGGTLFFIHSINRARERLWIASPYFVPDESVRVALQLAALRGVDVRIMLPEHPDHKVVYLASFAYLEEMEAAGVRMFRYGAGFLHQKVMLVDDQLASVGSANLDNRSMRLNFELSMVVLDAGFCGEVAEMLEADFEACREIDGTDYTSKPLHFRAGVRLARLAAPLL